MKKFMMLFGLFIFSNQEQLTSTYVPKLNYIFNNSFLKGTSPAVGFIKNLSVYTRVPMSSEVENRIFKLKLEDGANVACLTSSNVFEEQEKTFIEMRDEGCHVAVLPDSHQTVILAADLELEKKSFLFNSKFSGVKESVFIALLEYHSQLGKAEKRIALLATQDRLLTIEGYNQSYNSNEFESLQKWFDRLAKNSDRL